MWLLQRLFYSNYLWMFTGRFQPNWTLRVSEQKTRWRQTAAVIFFFLKKQFTGNLHWICIRPCSHSKIIVVLSKENWISVSLSRLWFASPSFSPSVAGNKCNITASFNHTGCFNTQKYRNTQAGKVRHYFQGQLCREQKMRTKKLQVKPQQDTNEFHFQLWRLIVPLRW